MQLADPDASSEWYNIQSVIRDQFASFYDILSKQSNSIERLDLQVRDLRGEIRDRDATIEQLKRRIEDMSMHLSHTQQSLIAVKDRVTSIPRIPSEEAIGVKFAKMLSIERDLREQEAKKVAVALEVLTTRCSVVEKRTTEAQASDSLIKRQLDELSDWKTMYADVTREIKENSISPVELNSVLEQKVDVRIMEQLVDNLRDAINKKVDAVAFDLKMDTLIREVDRCRGDSAELAQSVVKNDGLKKSQYADEMHALSQRVSLARSRVRSPGKMGEGLATF